MLLISLALLAGCSQSPAERSALVSGKVTLGGAPVATGTVLFMTDAGHAASAELKSDGTYALHCRPAQFKVAVTPPALPDPLASPASVPPSGPSATSQSIPKRYHDFGSSGLTVEVKEGNNTFDIALTR